jgi:hypothetical protein
MTTTVARRGAVRSIAARPLTSKSLVPVALLAPGLAGLGLAMAMPRGPVTTAGALFAMALAVTVGLAYGAAAHSRWAMLAAPLLVLVMFEAGRIGAEGPTVDAPALDTSYGILALVLGRGSSPRSSSSPSRSGLRTARRAAHAGGGRDPALPEPVLARPVRVACRSEPLGLPSGRVRPADAGRVPALPPGEVRT